MCGIVKIGILNNAIFDIPLHMVEKLNFQMHQTYRHQLIIHLMNPLNDHEYEEYMLHTSSSSNVLFNFFYFYVYYAFSAHIKVVSNKNFHYT
jgi:hypothetical protein